MMAHNPNPLLVAASHGCIGTAAVILQMQPQAVYYRDSLGQTPLMLASAAGHKQVVELLLRKSASVNAQNNQGESALTLAQKSNHQSVVSILLKHGAEHCAIHSSKITA